jgi:tetratricopeptide (TPR) repeat protein
MGWWVSGVLLAVLVVLVAIVELSDRTEPTVAGTPPGGGIGPAPNVDLSSMTPRQAADNLFDRVMRAVANGNTTEATNFLPMAIAAYDLARPLDADGLFHLSLLQRAAQEQEAALQSALDGLAANPDHLLNLYGAAEASVALGDSAAARGYYERLLAAWDREIAADRLEYEEHRALLPLIREDAEAFPSGGSPN